MTKADIAEQLYERVGVSKQEAFRITELLLDIMKETLERVWKLCRSSKTLSPGKESSNR